MTRIFPAKLNELDNVLQFTDMELEKAGCSMKAQTSIDVSLEEVFVNIANYAYPDGNGTVEIEVSSSDEEKAVIIRLADKGVQFDPLKKTDPDVTLGAEERNIGGLGIFMVKKMMDEVLYTYEDGKNILSLKKFF